MIFDAKSYLCDPFLIDKVKLTLNAKLRSDFHRRSSTVWR